MGLTRKKPWRRVSEKRQAGFAEEKLQRERDHQFFSEIWEERGGMCQITGDTLGPEPLSTMFHHILPKARFPQYRYCKWNILMLKPDIHAQIESDMDKVPPVIQLYDDLLSKHMNGELSP